MNINIRPLTINDAKTSVNWRNNSKIWEQTMNSPDRKITLDIETNWAKKVIAESSSRRFAIIADNVYIGNVQLTNIEDNESYFGIFIGERSYWGKGIGTRATRLILEYAFNELLLDNVKLRVKEKNTGACKVYSKVGFKKEKVEDGVIHMKISKDDFTSL
jgi:RimJ/RimL family protein N-acetyltransferase